ncbi:MAG: hypothetical protein GXY44_14755 [Phycisphaerales bacterium]|nr:hypothetical protein [Phycisphaerales bacterium]
MFKSSWFAVLVFGAASVSFSPPTMAEMIEVGSGTNSANLYLEFKGVAVFDFLVYFDGTTTGLGLFDIIEAHTTLTTVRENFGFGVFIDGISYAGYDNNGWGGGDDWWHYWIKDGVNDIWQSPMYGVADRVIADGYSDGWIYGRAGTPIPEPAAVILLACGLLMGSRKRGAHKTGA